MVATREQLPPPQTLRQGYEPPRVSNRGLLLFLFCFLLTAAGLHTGVWALEKYLMGRPRAADAVVSAVPPLLRRFPAPDVQPSESHDEMPWEDLADLRRSEVATFQRLGWAPDPLTGSAVIPDRIVAQLAERYKARGEAAAGAASPTTAPASAPATAPTIAPTTAQTTTAPANATPPPTVGPAPTTGTTPSPEGTP